MSLRDLVEPECGSGNPLVRLGTQITQDSAYKDEGISGPQYIGRSPIDNNQLVNEFLGHVSEPPQTFRMHDLIKEMQDIGKSHQIIKAPTVMEQIHTDDWAREFSANHTDFDITAPGKSESAVWGNFPHASGNQPLVNWTNEFFAINENQNETVQKSAREFTQTVPDDDANYSEVNLSIKIILFICF